MKKNLSAVSVLDALKVWTRVKFNSKVDKPSKEFKTLNMSYDTQLNVSIQYESAKELEELLKVLSVMYESFNVKVSGAVITGVKVS